ncbi:unnamed protein product [Brassicogethes aeneus]|uniref:CHK kinase-like domain-containing protein n=1 Tax=Brassicogethes aeneus TaxID=1431903 RepID=A0A9P0FE74_BRAAE|nr:unnamed protein product [Brassicogethes aeneus]
MEVPEQVENILKTITKDENIDEYDIDIHAGNKKGDGFLGELLFLDVIEKKTDKVLSLVFKKAFQQANLRDKMPIRQTFINEIYFYEDVYPELNKLQSDGNITNKFTNIAKCFYSTLEPCKEYIVMENLKAKGFEVFDKTKLLSMEHIELIFKTYGRFHGISFALSKKNPEKFQEIDEKCVNVFNIFGTEDHFKTAMLTMAKSVYDKLIPGEDDKLIKSLEKYLDKGHDYYLEGINYKGKYNTINHGDCWSNNMMFKYDNGTVSEITVIDWQLIKVGSPMHDLVYCLYTGTGKEVYSQLDYIHKIYYNSLTSTLKEFNLDVEEIYPFEALKEDWQVVSKFAMMFAFMICKIKLAVQEDMFDLTDFDTKEQRENPMFKMRVADSYDVMMKDLVTHMYDIGVL